MRKYPETQSRRGQRFLRLVGALLILTTVAGLSILAEIYPVLPLDLWVTRAIQRHQWARISHIMVYVSLFGYAPWSAITTAVGTMVVGLLLGWRDGLYLLLITLGQGLLNAMIKHAIGRPRPGDTLVEVFAPVGGYSFPSGHVMFYTVFFGFLFFLVYTHVPSSRLRWMWGAPLMALVLLVGPSRIILGAHWLSDVIAAYLLGLICLTLAIKGYLRFKAFTTLQAQPHKEGFSD